MNSNAECSGWPGCGEPSEHIAAALRDLVDGPARCLPFPGEGRTPERFELLARWAARDLTLGRLVEAHCDALAILAEAGSQPRPGASYGVWATRSGPGDVAAVPECGGWRLSGSKAFCSGAGMLERSLVTAQAPDGYRLFDVDLSSSGVCPVPGSWSAVGMAASASLTVSFEETVVLAEEAIGPPGFYLSRPGFWSGAVGVAACWYGGARALVEEMMAGLSPGAREPTLVDVGLAVSQVRSMGIVLQRAALDIDHDVPGESAPDESAPDESGGPQLRALACRQAVHDGCVDVLARVAAAGGARPLAHNRAQAVRAADLYVYLSQHHGGPDAVELAKLALGMDQWT